MSPALLTPSAPQLQENSLSLLSSLVDGLLRLLSALLSAFFRLVRAFFRALGGLVEPLLGAAHGLVEPAQRVFVSECSWSYEAQEADQQHVLH